jgi:superfamily I DNA/RNA helicase
VGTPLAEELSDRQVAELRGVIHPDVLITGGVPAAREPSSTGGMSPNVAGALFIAGTGPGGDGAGGDSGEGAGGAAVKVLDRRQEAFAKSLGHGHRVIRGVAGSGKTLVLVHRARLLARLRPGERILVTCFTRSLASMLRAQLAELPGVEVVNLDRLMKQAIDGAGLRHPGYGRGARPVAEAALDAVRRTGEPRYRAVLIDEAQDFDTEALRFCVELLDATEPDGQDLVVVADSAQNIFRKSFRWKDAGIRAQGRTRVLRVNYRNTREILELAHRFLTADPAISVDEVPDPEDELSIIPAESAERSGPAPTVVVADDADDEVRRVVEAVRRRWSPGMASRSIAVLHGDAQRDQAFRPARLLAALRAAGIPAFWVTDPQQRGNRDRAGSAGAAVVVSTIHSAKGLEFPEVVVCGLGARDDLTTARKLLYVGFTRAVDRLTVVVGASSPFRDDVLRAGSPPPPPVACKVSAGSAVSGGDGDDLGERVEGDGDELPDAGRAVP